MFNSCLNPFINLIGAANLMPNQTPNPMIKPMLNFTSNKGTSCIMYTKHALVLLKMLGATGNIPAAMVHEDLQKAILNFKDELDKLLVQEQLEHINNLQKSLKLRDENINRDGFFEDDFEKIKEQDALDLSVRAKFFLNMLEDIALKKGFLQWDYI